LIGFLIKHYAGNFPLWLAPDQVRVDADFSATPFKAKISNACSRRGNEANLRQRLPPPHVGGYGWSSAVATWKPAR
jgi:hypothetical protein